jgi:hypothetical protein
VLTEDAQQTLEGLLKSTTTLIEEIGRCLLQAWIWRREHPGVLQQPKEQWPGGVTQLPEDFAGYAPGSFPFRGTEAKLYPVNVRRMKAAALSPNDRAQWSSFD